MDEEAAKEDAEGVEPIVIEGENSPPRTIPADVGEASTATDVGEARTPRTQLVIPPSHLRKSSQPMLLGLLIRHLLDIFLVL